MKIVFAFAAVATALDADYVDDLSNSGVVLAPGAGQTSCWSCEVTGSSTANTLAACQTQGNSRGLQVCADAASANPQVCSLSITKNGAGEIVSLQTGCSEPNVSQKKNCAEIYFV